MTKAAVTRVVLVALAVCFGFTFLALIQTPSEHQGNKVQHSIQNPSHLSSLLGPSVSKRRLRYVKWRLYGGTEEGNSTGRGFVATPGKSQPLLSSIPTSFQEQVLSGLQLSCHPGQEGLFRPQYSRFLHILQEYVDLHHSMKQAKVSRTLTWHCPAQEYCGGLGDRIRGVTYALLLAIFSRRRLVVFWDGVPEGTYLRPHMIDWRDSKTYEFLRNTATAKKRLPASYEAPELFSFKVILEHGKVVNDVSSSDMSYYQRIISSNTTNVIIATNMEPSSLLHSDRNGDQNWIRSGLEWTGLSHLDPDVLDDLVGICFRYLFKLRKDVLDEVASAQNVLGLSGPYIALHLRTGFASMDHHEELQRHPKLTQNVSEWQASIRCAIKTANKVLGNSSVVYLATDSDMVKEMALEKYPQIVRMLKNSLVHVDLLRKYRQERKLSPEEEQEGVIGVWTELFLLAQANVLLRGESGYSHTAGQLCGLQRNSTRHCT